MVEQGGQKEGAPKKTTNKVSKRVAVLLTVGGLLVGGSGVALGLGHVGPEVDQSPNAYGVMLREGSEFLPFEYEVIVGRLALKESGEPLGNPNTSVNVYVAGNLIDVKKPLPNLIAKSSVNVFPQSSVRNAHEIAERITKDLKRQDPSRSFEPVAIPGFTSPTVK